MDGVDGRGTECEWSGRMKRDVEGWEEDGEEMGKIEGQ